MLPQTWPKIVSRSHLTCTDVNWRNNILFWADVTQREQPHWAEIRSCTFNSSANNQLCDSIMFKRAYGWTAEMVTCITHMSQTLSLSIYLQLHYFTWCASICYDGIRKLSYKPFRVVFPGYRDEYLSQDSLSAEGTRSPCTQLAAF